MMFRKFSVLLAKILRKEMTNENNIHFDDFVVSLFGYIDFPDAFWIINTGKKGYEVLVQGGVIDDLARHLVEQYGIPKKYIEVLDKTRR